MSQEVYDILIAAVGMLFGRLMLHADVRIEESEPEPEVPYPLLLRPCGMGKEE